MRKLNDYKEESRSVAALAVLLSSASINSLAIRLLLPNESASRGVYRGVQVWDAFSPVFVYSCRKLQFWDHL